MVMIIANNILFKLLWTRGLMILIVIFCTSTTFALSPKSDPDSSATDQEHHFNDLRHPLLNQPKDRSQKEKIARLPINVIEYPFYIMGKGLGKTLDEIERGAIFTKIVNFQGWLIKNHVLLGDGSQEDGSGFGVAAGFFGGIEPIQFSWSSAITVRNYQQHRFQVQIPGFLSSQSSLGAWGQYRQRTADNFYGIDPDAPDVKTQFQQSNVNAGVEIAYRPEKFLISGNIDWTDYDGIEDPNGDEISTLKQFPNLTGKNGATLMSAGIKITYPRQLYIGKPGPESGLILSGHTYWDTNDEDKYGFNRFSLTLYQSIPLFWGDRLLALRLMGSITEPTKGKEIPFFALNRIGGTGTLRGYDNLRFWDRDAILFNIEYRYPIWEIGHPAGIAMDAVWFYDAGVVAHAIEKDFRFDDFSSNFGGGIRLRTILGTLFRLNIAHSPELTRIVFILGGDF